MTAKNKKITPKKVKASLKKDLPIYLRIREILKSAHLSAARSINTTQVLAYWLIGQESREKKKQITASD